VGCYNKAAQVLQLREKIVDWLPKEASKNSAGKKMPGDWQKNYGGIKLTPLPGLSGECCILHRWMAQRTLNREDLAAGR